MKYSKAKEIAFSKLNDVGLSSKVGELYPSELSGGMQKRVALARAIATNPEVIFFDEPTTGLDPIFSDIINDLIVKCNKTFGATTITITHDLASAKKIASRLAMLYQGKMVSLVDVENMHNSNNPLFSQFINGQADGPIQYKI